MEETLAWQTHEYEHKIKSSDWYWILGIVVIFGALTAIVLKNLLFALFIVVAGFVMALYGNKKPDTIDCEVNKRGIRVDNKLYPFTSINTFWIDDQHEDDPRILMTMKNKFSLQVVIPLHGADTDAIHDMFIERVREEEQDETITERIMELLHF